MADERKPSDGADTKNDDATLEEALEIHDLCVQNEHDNRERAKEDLRFLLLEEQWPDEIKKLRKNRPQLVVNKLKAFRNQVVNDARQNTPAIKVSPVDDIGDPMTAEIYMGIIRNIEQVSRADIAYDTAVQSAVDGGWGYFRIDVDYSHDDTFDQDLTIKRVPNPLAVYGDPHSHEADSSDWNDAFYEDQMAKKLFRKRFKGAEEVDWSGYEGLEPPWKQDEEILVAEWWHRDEVTKPIVLLEDNEGEQFVLDRDVFEVHQDEAELQGITVKAEREVKSYKVTHRVMTGAEIVKEEAWIGQYIPIIPVYGEEVNIEGERHFRSLIRSAKDAQRLFNYTRSTEAELLQQAPRAPWIGPEEAFEGKYASKWDTANVENHSWLAFKGGVMPQRNSAGVNLAGWAEYALAMTDDIKATLGMFNASLGQQGNETSGRAIRERRVEGDTATFHFPDNLRRSIAHGGRVLLDLIPKAYTGKRIVRLLGRDKKTAQTIPLGRPVMAKPMPGGMPQIQQLPPQVAPDAMGGPPQQPPDTPPMGGNVPGTPPPAPDLPEGFTLKIFDLARGKYDLVAEAGPNFATKRQEAAEQMMELLRVFPQAAPIIGDLLAQNLDWPQADEIAARLKAMLPPSALGQEDPRLAQAMQMIETLKQALGQAQMQIQTMQTDQSVNMAKIGVDKAKLQTEGMKAQTAQFEAETARAQLGNQRPPPMTQAEIASADVARAQAETARLAALAEAHTAQFSADTARMKLTHDSAHPPKPPQAQQAPQ